MNGRDPPLEQASIVTPARVTNLEKRLNNRGRMERNKDLRNYPLQDSDELVLKQGELVFGFRQRATVSLTAGRPGISSESGFTSFNGIVPVNATTEEDFADEIYLLGYCRTNYDPFNKLTPKNGVAVTRALGPVQVAYDMSHNAAFPGDLMVWHLPGFPGEPGNDASPGMQYGRSGNRPPTKLIGRLEPYDPAYVADYLANIYETMMSDEDGVYSVSSNAVDGNDAFSGGGGGGGGAMPARFKAALALRQFTLFCGLRTIETLQRRGMLKILTPYEYDRQRLLDQLLAQVQEQQRGGAGLNQNVGALNPDIVETLGAIRELRPTDVTTGEKTRYVESGEEGGVAQQRSPIMTANSLYFTSGMHRKGMTTGQVTEAKQKEQLNVLFLAHTLGAVGNEPVLPIRDDVLHSVYPQYAMDALNADGGYAFTPDMDEVARKTGTPMASEYVRKAFDAASKLAATMTAAQHSYERRIAAKALTHGRGGGVFDERLTVYLTH